MGRTEYGPRARWTMAAGRTFPGRLQLAAILAALLACGRANVAYAQTSFGSSLDGQPVTLAVTVILQSSGTLGSIQVLMLGAANADFTAAASGSTCAIGTVYLAGENCAVAVTFTPAYPGLRPGAVVLQDSGGGLLATAYLAGTGIGAVGILDPGEITTVAGNGAWISVNDGRPATQAELYLPSGVAIDGGGNLYIADSAHNRIRKVDAVTGIISTIAGDGDAAYRGDNGPAVDATLNGPHSVALDGAGNVYIADTGNNVIRKIVAGSGIITTVAGNGTQGYGGDRGPAVLASLASPAGISVDVAGRLYIADTANHRIRAIAPSSGDLVTIAGNGATASDGDGSYSGDGGPATQAGLNFPYAVAFDAVGNLYIPDSGNQRIRVVYAGSGNIGTIAGNGHAGFQGDLGAATLASLNAPSGVAFDAAGNLYIADTQNNRIRKVNHVSGVIATIAGNGNGKYGGDDGQATSGGLFGPIDALVDALGNVFVADYFDHRIRLLSSSAARLVFKTAIQVGQVSAPQSQSIENAGNAELALAALTGSENTALDAASTGCSPAAPLAADFSCNVGVDFAPSQAGATVTGQVTATGPFVNSPLDIGVLGTALSLNPTAVLLTSSLNPAIYGQSISLLASVSTATGSPTGTMTFSDGANILAAPIAIGTSLTASYALAAPAVGLHSLTAAYSGDPQYLPSTSSVLAVVVNETTATTLASSEDPSLAGSSVLFSATVAPLGGGVTPTGTVAFSEASTLLGSSPLDAQGRAGFSTSGLAAGLHSIAAVYAGLSSAYILGSASAPLSQQVEAPTTTQVSSGVNPSIYGQGVSLLATVSSVPAASGIPTGTVTFSDGANLLGPPVVLGSAAGAGYLLAAAAVGLHSLAATYSGDARHLPSASAPLAQIVNETTATALASSPNPSVAGASVLFSANVTPLAGGLVPSGPITFNDGSTVLGFAPLDSQGKAVFATGSLSAGSHSITAVYAGLASASILGSASAALSQQVLASTSTQIASATNPSIYGTTVLFTASVASAAGAAPIGVVNFFDRTLLIGSAALLASGGVSGGSALSSASLETSSLVAGLHAITAVYAGSQDSIGSASIALAQTVDLSPTSVAAAANPNPSVVTSPVVITSKVSGSGPSGSIAFLVDGVSLGTQPLDATGTSVLSTSALAVGQHLLLANYPGGINTAPSESSSFPFTVQPIPTTTSFTIAAGGGSGAENILTSTVAGTLGPVPTGTVVFESGSTALGAAALNVAGVAALTVTLTASMSDVVATYSGDSLHGPSFSAQIAVAPFLNGFRIALEPASITLAASQNFDVTVLLNPVAGFTDLIGLGCASLPPLVTCHFSTDSVAVSAGAPQVLQLTVDTNSPLSGGTVAKNASPLEYRGEMAMASIAPATALFLWFAGRKRKRPPRLRAVLLLTVSAAASSLLLSCGSISQKSAAAGTYVIQVVGTGVKSGVTQAANLTITVTR